MERDKELYERQIKIVDTQIDYGLKREIKEVEKREKYRRMQNDKDSKTKTLL